MQPLYIWAGGKGKLLSRYEPILNALPSYDAYVEPFFGGGALYGSLSASQHLPALSLINDVNSELIGLLRDLRDDPEGFVGILDPMIEQYLAIEDHGARKEHYYALRQSYWDNPSPSLLFLLMRLCFNGLWQTCKASQGLFGSPAGLLKHQRKEQLYKPDLLRAWAQALSHTSIHNEDYASLAIPKNSLIFLDPT